jgi:hypothetical protein
MFGKMVSVVPGSLFPNSWLNKLVGSSFHVVDYNSTTGVVIRRHTAQGYADNRYAFLVQPIWISHMHTHSPPVLGVVVRLGVSMASQTVRLELSIVRSLVLIPQHPSVQAYAKHQLPGDIASHGCLLPEYSPRRRNCAMVITWILYTA